MKCVTIKGPEKNIEIGTNNSIVVIAGPCVIEGLDFALYSAEKLKEIFEIVNIPFIYKSSFDKANRSSGESFRGVGIDEGLKILEKVRQKVNVPILTDVHDESQVIAVSEVVDMIQTPAFLCRQTDFIQATAKTNKPVNIKKGQFLSPYDMQNVLDKALGTGNNQITLCERGSSFGYGNLVVDMRGLQIMAATGYPVIFDATHSVQLPGAKGNSSGGQREFVPALAKAATAIGVGGLFIETHPEPWDAPSDGPNMIPFAELEELLRTIKNIDNLIKNK